MRCQWNEGNSDQCTSTLIAEKWTLRTDAADKQLSKELEFCWAHGMGGIARTPQNKTAMGRNYAVTEVSHMGSKPTQEKAPPPPVLKERERPKPEPEAETIPAPEEKPVPSKKNK